MGFVSSFFERSSIPLTKRQKETFGLSTCSYYRMGHHTFMGSAIPRLPSLRLTSSVPRPFTFTRTATTHQVRINSVLTAGLLHYHTNMTLKLEHSFVFFFFFSGQPLRSLCSCSNGFGSHRRFPHSPSYLPISSRIVG